MDKLKIKIDERVMNIIKSIDEELKGNLEFNGYLITDKSNVWRITDIIIPKQNVSGASVDEEDGKKMRSQYEEKFIEFLKNKGNQLIIGTMHSHNSMGSFHSFTDIDDVDNHAYLNLNEKLPFIDIVWSHKETKAWVALKFNNGMGKQVFVVQPDNIDIEIIETNETEQLIEEIKRKHKDYEIDEELLKRALTKKISVKSFIGNIKEKQYNNYGYNNRRYTERTIIGEMYPQLHIERRKNTKSMIIKVKNDFENCFADDVGLWLEDAKKKYGVEQEMAKSFENSWELTISCGDKPTFRKMKREIEELLEDYKDRMAGELEEETGISFPRDRSYQRKLEPQEGCWDGNHWIPSEIRKSEINGWEYDREI